MRMMESILLTDRKGKTAELIRHPKGYRVTIWDGWSIIFRHTFLSYENAKNHLDSMKFVKKNY